MPTKQSSEGRKRYVLIEIGSPECLAPSLGPGQPDVSYKASHSISWMGNRSLTAGQSHFLSIPNSVCLLIWPGMAAPTLPSSPRGLLCLSPNAEQPTSPLPFPESLQQQQRHIPGPCYFASFSILTPPRSSSNCLRPFVRSTFTSLITIFTCISIKHLLRYSISLPLIIRIITRLIIISTRFYLENVPSAPTRGRPRIGCSRPCSSD